LDSSFISALVKKYFNHNLQTFSIAFSNKDYDESRFQNEMAGFLGTEHHSILCNFSDIGKVMPEVVWHAEKPLIRTAPAPLFLLSRFVRNSGIKVVLTGGALMRSLPVTIFSGKPESGGFGPGVRIQKFARYY